MYESIKVTCKLSQPTILSLQQCQMIAKNGVILTSSSLLKERVLFEKGVVTIFPTIHTVQVLKSNLNAEG